jgi:hypothetical protein
MISLSYDTLPLDFVRLFFGNFDEGSFRIKGEAKGKILPLDQEWMPGI